jgi:hypothetical protein
MTLGDIEKADEILDAISRGRLAVFAGAGVSMQHEMQLPGFAGLAKEVTRRCHRPSPVDNEHRLDKFLGDLCDSTQVDVHNVVRQIIASSDSKCNPIHKDLMGLFKSGDLVRIVTTNYDKGFETAAFRLGVVPRSYSAPALPLGNDFSGIVHIHGCVDERSSMVVTDRDYGRAYLTEGWARRFLIGLFGKYSVLFVGYSHRDSDLNYLVRALGAGGEKLNRYALLASQDLENDGERWWTSHGVTPIIFESHEAIAEGVRLLSQYVDPSPEANRDQISKIVSLAPSLSGGLPLEVKLALEKEETARYFATFAKSPDWVRLLDREGCLEFIFSNEPILPRQAVISSWVARQFLDDESEVLHELISGHEFRISEQFRRTLLFAISSNKKWPSKSAERALKRWAALIFRTFEVSPGDRSLLEFLAERCAERRCYLLAVDVFIQMASHRVVPAKKAFFSDERVRMEVELTSEYYNLQKVWNGVLRPRLNDISERLLAGVCECINKMHCEALLWSGGEDDEVFWRSAIEPHIQDKQRHDGFGVLVDAARDAIEYLGTYDPDGFSCRASHLLESDCSFHRRLGIHALRVHNQCLPDEKIQTLLKYVNLSSEDEHHECYLLILENYAGANDEVRGLVRRHIESCATDLSSRPGYDAESGDRFSFLWLDCIVKSAADCILARNALDDLRTKYPQWSVGDHPSFRRYISSGEWVDPRPEYYADQIVQMRYEPIVDWYQVNEGSDGCRALGVQLVKACKQNIDYAFGFVRHLKSNCEWSPDLWTPVIESFSDAAFPVDRIDEVLNLINEPKVFTGCARSIADFVEACVKNHGNVLSDSLMARIADFSELVWAACSAPDLTSPQKLNWLGTAINDPSGRIVLSWVEMLSVSMKGKTDASRCLPSEMESRLTRALDSASSKADMARVILASQYRFFHGLNSKWSRECLLPLFRSQNEEHFYQAWDGFLTWGSLSPSVESDLRPAFMAAIKRLLLSSRKEYAEKFIRLYAIMAVYQQGDPLEDFISEFLVESETLDGVFGAKFASAVCFIMGQMSYDDQTRVGKKWVLGYCKQRSEGLPVRLTDAELSELLNLIPKAGDAFPALVDVLTRLRTITFKPAWLYELEDAELAKKHPVAMVHLLVYMSRCEGSGQYADSFRRVRDLLTELPAESAGSLRSAMLRIGVD